MTENKKHKVPELKVVFDTNVLWTESANNLMKLEVRELIRGNSHHSDLRISWIVPAVVRHERQFQILKNSIALLDSIRKLERLLGHNLNITEEIITERVNASVEQQIKDLGIEQHQIDPTLVNWAAIMLNSSYRKPPFSPGEKEKGFRDSLVVETVRQVVESSPTTPKHCRVVLVSADDLLGTAVAGQHDNATNVRVVTSIEELKGLINTLVSEVAEEFVNGIREQAGKCFFIDSTTKTTLYYTDSVFEKLSHSFAVQLQALTEGVTERENGTRHISPPQFVRKKAQRVHWSTRIAVECSGYQGERAKSQQTLSALQHFQTFLYEPAGAFPQQSLYDARTGLNLRASEEIPIAATPRVLVKKGKTIFEVDWSVIVSTAKKLSKPQIDGLRFVETTWDSIGSGQG